jgi:iron(III) transport system ATP-binding protein
MSDLALHDLHKRFGGQSVLSGLELHVPAGSFMALLGPSGVGKTTLLRLLAGFETPDRGTITVGGRTLSSANTHVPPERRRIGYMPQEGSLFPHLTVAANIGFGLERADRRGRVDSLLELVGLTGLERRYPHQLSGGQQQRVALARALAVKPDVILLDEPFASLDTQLRSGVREDVRRILREAGTTTLLVTHNQDEALSMADTVAVLRDGRVAQQASPRELYTEPADDELARFVGDANLLEGTLSGDHVETPLGRLRIRGEVSAGGDPHPTHVKVLIRPEQIALASAADTHGHPGHVISCGFHGHDTVFEVRIGHDQNAPALLVRTLGGHTLAPGDSCSLTASGPVLVWPQVA